MKYAALILSMLYLVISAPAAAVWMSTSAFLAHTSLPRLPLPATACFGLISLPTGGLSSLHAFFPLDYGIPIVCKGGSVAEWLACWTQAQKARVQIAAATLSGNSLRQTVHTHRASVHQAAKLVAALVRVARVTAGLAESNGSLPPGLWLTSPASWLPRTGISSGTLRSVIEYGLPFYVQVKNN